MSPVQSKHSTQRPKGTFLATVTRRARLALLLVADDAQLGRCAALHAAQRRTAARARRVSSAGMINLNIFMLSWRP